MDNQETKPKRPKFEEKQPRRRTSLSRACALWITRKATSLADVLIERGWMTAEDQTTVDSLLERKLKKHRGDARASLALWTKNPRLR